MAEREFVKDKVYLKNNKTGQIYEYEKLLEKHPDFDPFVPNPSKPVKNKDTPSGIEKKSSDNGSEG